MNRSLIDLRHRMARSIALLGLMLVSLLLCGQASAAPTLSPPVAPPCRMWRSTHR
ncbi:hypothetical protein NWF32_24350 [Pseudomonas qingdaonensis]|nr:hypothetical protein [Pseudomonas qingdaonensis]